MAKLTSNPTKLFESNKDKLLYPTLHGVTTFALELEDETGKYFAMPALEQNRVFSQVCGTVFLDQYITRVDYDTYNGHVILIKAYF